MSNQDKLLSDEELDKKITDIYKWFLHDKDYNTIDNGRNYEQLLFHRLKSLINTQKRLYAESVIGKRYPIEVGSKEYQETREELRAEQRARIK